MRYDIAWAARLNATAVGRQVNVPKIAFRLAAAAVVFIVAALTVYAITVAVNKPLRGDTEPSPDGKTYLAVMDKANCSQLRVDGKDWPWEEGVRRPVSPGTHLISCHGESGIEFSVREGEVFNFDYWGP